MKAHALRQRLPARREQRRAAGSDRPGLTRRLCDRHRGIGADGVMFFTETADGASMQLLNADGSPSEVSGNGVRCLAAWLARERGVPIGTSLAIHTDAGVKTLRLEAANGARLTFRAAMGSPEHVRQRTLDVDGEGRRGRSRCGSAILNASCSAR